MPASSRTIDELLRTCALSEDCDKPVVFYPDSGVNYVGYSIHQIDTYASRAAITYGAQIPTRQSSHEEPTVVALLGVSDLDYIITFLALTKLGHTVLFLSPRLTKAAYVWLLQKTDTKHVVFQPSLRSKAEELSSEGVSVIEIVKQEIYGQPFVDQKINTDLTPRFDLKAESQKPAWIFHSSGSTGLPKPVHITHRGALSNYRRNIEKLNMRCFLSLPLFHTHGISSFFRAIITCKPIYLYNASLPLTKDYLVQCLEQNEVELFSAVPYALKALSESEKGIELLRRLKFVMFGGSPCPDDLGDMLVDKGVNLVSVYGMSEAGPLMMSIRPPGDNTWNYLRATPEAEPFLYFEPKEQGLYELVCLEGLPSKSMSNREDGSYATKDLFLKHPYLNAWKYCGRNDDVIVLENGEKVNPVDIENAIMQHHLVTVAVVFGVGRPYPGLLIIPSSKASGLPQNEIIDHIWAVVEGAQAMTPGHAKISRETVIILSPGTSYPKTDKETFIRKVFYAQFSKEIESFYNIDLQNTEEFVTDDELPQFIQSEVQKILGIAEVAEDSDFFALGMDSLQASRLRNILVQKLGLSRQKGLGINVVFDHPSISFLTDYLKSLRQGTEVTSDPVNEQITHLIDKYSRFEQHVRGTKITEGQRVVLTGTTGSLGAHLLSTLVHDPDVRRIYCLVRAESRTHAHHRVIRSLHSRNLYRDLPFSLRQKIVCLPSDFSQPCLGLSSEEYQQIAEEITVLYHCAWKVNFNLRLSSFEDNIAGVKHLIDLCLHARAEVPATFTFFSSIGTVLRTENTTVPETLPAQISNAQPTGYGQSKLVAEYICMNAAARVGIPVYVLRIGQIVGDTVHGIWNSSEAIPLMMQTAVTMKVLPEIDECLRWIPVDLVARSSVEITSSGAAVGVFNLINPHTIHWTHDVLPYLRKFGLEFDIVSSQLWLQRLQAASDPAINPPVRLFEYFQRQLDSTKIAQNRNNLKFETEKSQRWSRTFADVQSPDQGLILKMIRYFLSTSWNKDLQDTPGTPIRSVIAFVTSELLVPVAGTEFPAVELVSALVSLRVGIPISKSETFSFGQNHTTDGIIGGKQSDRRTNPDSSMITIICPTETHKISGCQARFIVLRSTTTDSAASPPVGVTKDKDDVVTLDATSDWKDLVNEAEFWVRDFLRI
ncbi:NRPS-like enzyme, putative [Paecilomyces variotii No. 5]|uniref:NRPS-like enzyme, putative n=1 Tax=Byssochlamys spectabilis (strain No. 5 / NBRC 109023) TaxID=1356009 RepID=V5FXA2_BYSSN|nr:NRPS-like enzyme, putative [Paecilomyces variotii No. 5]